MRSLSINSEKRLDHNDIQSSAEMHIQKKNGGFFMEWLKQIKHIRLLTKNQIKFLRNNYCFFSMTHRADGKGHLPLEIRGKI